MSKRTARIALSAAGALVVCLLAWTCLVFVGALPSPLVEVWVYVGTRGSYDLIPQARVYIDGRFVGSTRAAAESLRLIRWRYGTSQVSVVKSGYATWSRSVDWNHLRKIEEGNGPIAGPFELSITLERQSKHTGFR
jgi:hypothetical protein